MKRQLTQREIDAVFQNSDSNPEAAPATTTFDFSRLDRIPKSRLNAIHQLHEDFVRSLSSNLSAYLRAAVTLNLVSLEQISYSEYLEGLASPTCLAYVSLKPYEGTAIMEISPSVVFTLVELLLGGSGKETAPMQRKITEIEKGIMQGVLRVILNELHEAWKNVADIRFAVQLLASEPQLMHVLDPTEAVVVITLELRVGPATGVLNLAIPSIFIKRLNHKFEQMRQVRRADPTERDRANIARLIGSAGVSFEARLEPTRVLASDLIDLEVGDVLTLGHSLDRPVTGLLNGQALYSGHIVVKNEKLMLQVHKMTATSTTERLVRPATT